MANLAALSVQIGPLSAHAEGGLAIGVLFGVFALYVLGPVLAAELVRRFSGRRE